MKFTKMVCATAVAFAALGGTASAAAEGNQYYLWASR